MAEKSRIITEVGEFEMSSVVARLALTYASRVAKCRARDDDEDACPDVAWCLGETLAACGGYDLMWLVYRMVEERHGPACAAWLDRSWDGVCIPDIVWWRADHSDRDPA